MDSSEDKKSLEEKEVEDATLYGEFISSFDSWITLDNQRKTASKLEDVTKKGKKTSI